jgi:hypothetical protein
MGLLNTIGTTFWEIFLFFVVSTSLIPNWDGH